MQAVTAQDAVAHPSPEFCATPQPGPWDSKGSGQKGGGVEGCAFGLSALGSSCPASVYGRAQMSPGSLTGSRGVPGADGNRGEAGRPGF